MEIRVGMKYKYPSGVAGEVTSVVGNEVKGNFISPNHTGGFTDKVSSFLRDASSGKLTVLSYPYKFGDWVVALYLTQGFKQGQLLKVNYIQGEALQLEDINGQNVFSTWNRFNFRPAFASEIPVKVEKEIPRFEFKIGKWYEITNNVSTYIIKVGDSKYNNSTFLGNCWFKVKDTDHIGSPGGGFHTTSIKESRELTLSQVQKYLPIDHEDRFIEKTINTEPMNDDFERQLAMQEQALALAGKLGPAPTKGWAKVPNKEEELEFYKNSLKKVTKENDFNVFTSVNSERSSTLDQIKPRVRHVSYVSTTLVMR